MFGLKLSVRGHQHVFQLEIPELQAFHGKIELGPEIIIMAPVPVQLINDKLLRENYNQYFLLGICPSRLFRTFNEANILLIVYFDNMFDLQSQKLQLESV